MGSPSGMHEESYVRQMVEETRDIAIRLDRAIRGNGKPGLKEQVRRNTEKIEEIKGAGIRFWARVIAIMTGVGGFIEIVHWIRGG